MTGYRVIAMEADARKDHFAYFQGMGYPYLGVTVNVDLTDWQAAVKAKGLPVSLLCHHALVDGIHLNRFFEQLDTRLKDFL